MDNSKLVLGLLESLLGKAKGSTVTNDYAFYCPICNHHNPKLIVNIKSGQYNCWVCDPPTKGKTPVSLLKKIEAPKDAIIEMKGYFKSDTTKIDDVVYNKVVLPKEFKSLIIPDGSLDSRHALAYLKKRGISNYDIIKYNIGYCSSGRYRDKVIVPSYDANGQINYFIARSYKSNSSMKIDAPSCNKSDIIGFEYHINWSVPVILCEGIFDAIAIKRNAIPLFGKSIPKALMMKLVESEVKTIYLALDQDAIKEATNYSQKLIDMGKEVYLLNLEEKDPSDLGLEKMISLLHNAKPLTFMDLFLQKMQLA
jgi:DNA primase